ncbi:MAG: alpha/beta fold hydrolase [Alteromonadaceae bacterium]|nr:alpha/beta fold hydrolase [Alteromonadaceae bacterium]
MSITINILGELAVFKNDTPVGLPASKRTRALLAFLAITSRPHRRDRLCEVFWEIPDDPRGALRWSLSKIRPLVNDDTERLIADRERVRLDTTDINIDLRQLISIANNRDLSVEKLTELAESLNSTLLDGIDLPNQELFQQWLTAERAALSQTRASILRRLVSTSELSFSERLKWAREWEQLEPFNPKAATSLLTVLELMGRSTDALRLTQEFTTRFRNAGIAWSPDKRKDYTGPEEPDPCSSRPITNKTSCREILARQRIQFCKAHDNVRLAYASVGEGKPIVKAANWLNHLEYDWDAPIWSPLFRELAKDHRFIRYDERGNGLSDWNVADISFDTFVTDLESVVQATQVDKFALLGISQGAAVSIDYTVRHPHKVSHLILFGGYAAGWRHNASAHTILEREAVMTLTAAGWGQDNPAYRHIFSSTFMPDATLDELNWFDNFQRLTTSPKNAVRFLDVFSQINVVDLLPKIRVPTLVIHSLGDNRIPVDVGRDLAATIPNAEFVGLESNGHLLLGREPASAVFLDAIRDFLKRHQ